MIRFSLVIQNNKDEFLICECPSSNANLDGFEFLGGEILTDTLPPFDWLMRQIKSITYEKIAVEIDEIQKLEMYWKDDPLWIHAIFVAKIKSGNPQKKYYKKLLWQPFNEINIDTLNLYGIQVYRKIDECSYCQYIHRKHSELDKYFKNFFDREEENLAVLRTVEASKEDDSTYLLAFKQEMIHLRASLIENSKLKKNITVQNYFRLYGRNDLAERMDALLQIQVRADLTLKEMIKESVDKYIAHYDEPSPHSDGIYKYCLGIFSFNGKLPLKDFIPLIDNYIMALITEMWYDAGELGISMSDRCIEDRRAIIEQGENCANELYEALNVEV